MMTQKVDFYSRVNSAQTGAKSSGQNYITFGDVLNQNATTSNKNANMIKPKENTVRKSEDTQKKDSLFPSKRACDLKSKDIVSDENNTVEENGSTKEIPTEKMEEAMMQMQNIIVDNVTKTLNISEEELNTALNELNLSIMDLMDPANAAKLLMKINDISEPMQLLTDETLMSQLHALNNSLENLNLPNETGITKEEVIKYYDQMPPNETLKTLQTFEIHGNEVMDKVNPQDKQNLDVKENEKTLDDISITVEKESTSENVQKDGTNTDLSKDSRNARQDSKQDKAAPMETFVQNLAVKGQNSELTVEAAAQKVETMRSIVEQVVKQIKVEIKPGAASMELQLNPENLGKINLVVASRDGQLTATITTQNEMAKEALQGQLQILRESLESQGLKVDAVEVTVSEFAFHSNEGNHASEDEKPSKNQRRKIDLSSFDETAESSSEEDILAAKILKDNGGSVDYTA